jgi:hypothetical protein
MSKNIPTLTENQAQKCYRFPHAGYLRKIREHEMTWKQGEQEANAHYSWLSKGHFTLLKITRN